MKRSTFFLVMFFAAGITFGQMSDKFVNAMKEKITLLDSNLDAAAWKELGNSFERIAEAEKTQWLPYYYSAFSNVMAGYRSMTPGDFGDHSATLDPFADKAESLLNKAEALSKDNSEIWCVRKMIATLRLSANAMARYMTEGPISEEAINKAKSLNPNNPRVYLLMGQDKFYTPEQFGGSKSEARNLFEEAMKHFSNFRAESPIHPAWGLSQAKWMLSQTN